jgi:ketosteroid isomerase-like protein
MSRENVEIVRALWATLDRDAENPWPTGRGNELDRRLRLDLTDENMEIRNLPEFPVGREYHGHEGVRQWAIEIWEVFTELRHQLLELIEGEDGETVVSVQRTQGRMRHTRLDVDLPWAVVWTIRNGKAVRAHAYMSKGEALEAAGLRE